VAAHQICARAQARAWQRWDQSVEDVLRSVQSSRGSGGCGNSSGARLASVDFGRCEAAVVTRDISGSATTSCARPKRLRFDSPPSGGGSFHEEEEAQVIAVVTALSVAPFEVGNAGNG